MKQREKVTRIVIKIFYICNTVDANWCVSKFSVDEGGGFVGRIELVRTAADESVRSF